MEGYYGVIFFKDGHKEETSPFYGGGAEQQCERHTRMQFEQKERTAINDYFKPCRYEVRRK